MVAGLVVVVVVNLSGTSPPPAWAVPSDADLDLRVRKAQPSLVDRLVDVTEPFVGAPYMLNALGEGPTGETDQDPLVRYDAFDCTTLVETALALTHARDVAGAKELLTRIRYRDGKVHYLQRRHFPEAEWIPELEKLGYLEDVTKRVGGDAVVVATKKINLEVWHRNRFKKTPAIPDERIPSGTFGLPMLPLAAAQKNPDVLPAGAILNIIRHDYRSVPVRVSHQALVLVKNGKKIVRHASDIRFHRVVDESVEDFLAALAKDTKWPVSGLNITMIVPPKG